MSEVSARKALKAASAQKPTEYVVLELDRNPAHESPVFKVVGGVENGKPRIAAAATKQQAIKAACTAAKVDGGIFVAVPAASFKPVAYEIEKKPVDKWGDASL